MKKKMTEWQNNVERFLSQQNVETVTYKDVKRFLKFMYGEEWVEAHKQEIKEYASKVAEQSQEKEGKTSQLFIPGERKTPRNLNKRQADTMTTETFLKHAPPLDVMVQGVRAIGKPYVMKSGNKGWWSGGKIPLQIGDQEVWAQLGITLTIPGSKAWK